MNPTATSLYLQGTHAPVTDELVADDLPVTGEIPRELCGMYVRNSAA